MYRHKFERHHVSETHTLYNPLLLISGRDLYKALESAEELVAIVALKIHYEEGERKCSMTDSST